MASPSKSGSTTLREIERRHIFVTLEMCGWRISGKHGAGVLLDIKPTTLEARMKKLGIRRATASLSAASGALNPNEA